MNKWLEQLNGGDTVILISGDGYLGKKIARVARTTPTQIILESGFKYHRRDGRPVGGDRFSNSSIREATPELVEETRKIELCGLLRQVVWEKIGLATLEELFAKAKNGQHISAQAASGKRDNNATKD